MTRRRKILLLSACGLIAVVALCFFSLREKEPSYNGRTLSEWLRDYHAKATSLVPDGEEIPDEESAAAVSAIGTNAIPILVKWLKEPALKRERSLDSAAWKIPNERLRDIATDVLWKSSIRRKHYLAGTGFIILGTNAINALPDLANQFNTSDDFYVTLIAAQALSSMGDKGLSVLIAAVRAPDMSKRRAAIACVGDVGAAGHLGTNTSAAVTALIDAAKSEDRSLRWVVIVALGQLGEAAKPATPLLYAAQSDPDLGIREQATRALRIINPAGQGTATNSAR